MKKPKTSKDRGTPFLDKGIKEGTIKIIEGKPGQSFQETIDNIHSAISMFNELADADESSQIVKNKKLH